MFFRVDLDLQFERHLRRFRWLLGGENGVRLGVSGSGQGKRGQRLTTMSLLPRTDITTRPRDFAEYTATRVGRTGQRVGNGNG